VSNRKKTAVFPVSTDLAARAGKNVFVYFRWGGLRTVFYVLPAAARER